VIDYATKLTTHRAFYPIDDLDYSVESDRGRVISSPALRRLQKRTQVFALELNASIRTRLTHSLEVAQTARFIAKTILQRLDKEEGLRRYGLEGRENAFVSTVEIAALLHDIGNPPFGHFGEATINKYVAERFVPLLQNLPASSDETKCEKEKLIRDICAFEGNAQAVRIVTKLQRLNLSFTQTLSILKYTRAAYEPAPDKNAPYAYLRKKPGFYLSEEKTVREMCDTLGVARYRRFPLTYVMEAADDIAYLTADLEDAVDKGVLSLEEVRDLIIASCERYGERFLKEVVEEQFQRIRQSEDAPYRFNMFFTLLRAKVITKLVNYVAERYIEHHEEVFEGAFDGALLQSDSSHPLHYAVKVLQEVSMKHIYRSKTVQERELQGYRVLTGLMEYYMPLVELDAEDFERLMKGERIDCFIAEPLLKRISQKQIATYRADSAHSESENEEMRTLYERYFRMRLVLDYVSGMTDDYALYEYRLLGANL
jgi:dGTPase